MHYTPIITRWPLNNYHDSLAGLVFKYFLIILAHWYATSQRFLINLTVNCLLAVRTHLRDLCATRVISTSGQKQNELR
jgi:hypothetical protein